jgi:hypothetical protein
MDFPRKVLVCIYTCKKDEDSLNKLLDSDWFKSISSISNFKFIKVYADESIDKDFILDEDSLILKTEEDYLNLSVKTFLMIKHCYENFEFDFLLKIDSSIIEDNHFSVSPVFSFENFKNKFKESFFSKPYNGYAKIEGNSLESFKNWASLKSVFVLPEPLFEEIGFDKWPNSYWSGKSYSISRELIPLVLESESLFYKFKNLMGGCEDFCIGMILRDHMV